MPYHFGLMMVEVLGKCPLCHLAPIEVGYLCQACDESIQWLPSPFQVRLSCDAAIFVQPASYYDDTIRRAIAAFKDSENLLALPLLVQACYYLGQAVETMPCDTVILPVPTTHRRMAERGFYPVGLLAKYVSYITGYPIYKGVCRIDEGVRQRGLSRSERLSNLQQAFDVKFLPKTQSILILDDVGTTGATFGSVAEALLQANKKLHIQGVCLAHGKNPKKY